MEEKILIEKQFNWGDQKWRIPAIYRSQNKITVDFILTVDLEAVKKYLEKWNYEQRILNLTNEEYEELERDNPFSIDFYVDACINGEKVTAENMRAMGYHPFETECEYIDEETVKLMDRYQCDKTKAYFFVKAYFLWAGNNSIEQLSLHLEPNLIAYTGSHFHTKLDEEKFEIVLEHPATRKKHILKVLRMQQEKLTDESFNISTNMEYPKNYTVLSYTVEPEIDRMEMQLADCAASDQPIPLNEKQNSNVSIIADSSVSVIGRENGPTSVFIVGKSKDAKAYTACSSLHFKEVTEVEWRVIFHIKEKESIDIEVIEKERQ